MTFRRRASRSCAPRRSRGPRSRDRRRSERRPAAPPPSDSRAAGCVPSGRGPQLPLVVRGSALGGRLLLLLLARDVVLRPLEVVDLLLLLGKLSVIFRLVGRELRIRFGIGHLVAARALSDAVSAGLREIGASASGSGSVFDNGGRASGPVADANYPAFASGRQSCARPLSKSLPYFANQARA